MTVPSQVTFRDIPHSDAVLAHVERRVAKLETWSDRITRCQIVVEAPHRHHKHGKRFHVRIDLHVPGKELIVTKNPEDMKEDMHAAIDDAFTDAERVLEEYVRLQRDEIGPRSRSPRGVVAKVFHDRRYGFIRGDGSDQEVYFHANSVMGGRFEKIAVGAKVRFAVEDGDKGPQASTVHLVS
jgi:ribosomal subunit interface protein